MKFLSNAHTHTPWCDGASPAAETLRAATALGFVSLGFSGHGNERARPDYYMSPAAQEAYRAELLQLRETAAQTPGAPRIWIGIEQDTSTEPRRREACRGRFEYVIGATHNLDTDFHGRSVAVDGDFDLLLRYVREVLDGDMLAMAARYFDRHAGGLLESPPDIVAHFDLVRKYAESRGIFDPADPAYRRMALEALERAFPCGGVLEINTGGMARGYCATPYPSLELLRAWHDLGGRVTVTSDCHDARRLDFAFDAATALARRAGFRTALRLGRGAALWEEVDL